MRRDGTRMALYLAYSSDVFEMIKAITSCYKKYMTGLKLSSRKVYYLSSTAVIGF